MIYFHRRVRIAVEGSNGGYSYGTVRDYDVATGKYSLVMHSANIGGGGGGAGPTVVKLPEDGVDVCREGKPKSGKGGGVAGGEAGEGRAEVVVPEKKIHWKKKAAAARHAGMIHGSAILCSHVHHGAVCQAHSETDDCCSCSIVGK